MGRLRAAAGRVVVAVFYFEFVKHIALPMAEAAGEYQLDPNRTFVERLPH